MRFEELERQLLDLPPSEKARLLHELVRSFENTSPAEIESIWLEEAERRDSDMEISGDSGIGGLDALQRIRTRLGKI